MLSCLRTLQLSCRRPDLLTDEQVVSAVRELVSDSVDVTAKAEFLTALARKGETPEEITAFARELRSRCLQPSLDPRHRSCEILDVVGTGGDRLSTFNISTTVALLAAAAGVLVTKHGNRASTSSIGSADVMEALGIPFDLSPERSGALASPARVRLLFCAAIPPGLSAHYSRPETLCAARAANHF